MCRDIDNTIGYNRSTEAWKKIKNIRSNKRSKNTIQIITSKEWTKHYTKLLQENRPEYISYDPVTIITEEAEITEEDINKALKKSKNNKAPGPGNIKMELLKYGGARIVSFIRMLFNKIEAGEKIPDEWNLSYMSSIFKKGDKRSPNNYRGISVMPSIARIFSSVIKEKLEQHMDHYSEEQAGFRKARSCLDNIFIMRQVIEKNKERFRESIR